MQASSLVIWGAPAQEAALLARLSGAAKVVKTLDEFLVATAAANAVGFVDRSTMPYLSHVDPARLDAPIIYVCSEPLRAAIGSLVPHPWMCHVISTELLDSPIAGEHLANMMFALAAGGKPRLLDWIPADTVGRRVRLTHASRRVARINRMADFFRDHGIQAGGVTALRDIAEQLLAYVFYDAPVAAGALATPVERTQDVALPDESACDFAYACRDDVAIIRIRDPFGALSRHDVVEALARGATSDASSGLWRVFSAASFAAVSVAKGRYTAFLAGVLNRAPAATAPYAFHLFFRDTGKRRFWRPVSDHSPQPSSANRSVMLTSKK